MEQSFTTLFGRQAELPWPKKIMFGVIGLPFILPFAILAAISIPWTYIQKSLQRRRERTFTEQMKKAGRLMYWQELKQVEANGTGTVIGEYLSTKGPFRLWWTPDDIPTTSPHKWRREQHFAWMEDEFIPFFEWCYERYTNPQSGAARLVAIPEEERKQLNVMLDGSHFVSTCSFRSIREKGAMNGRS